MLGKKASLYDTLIVRYCNVSKLSDNLANLALTVLLTTQVHIKHLYETIYSVSFKTKIKPISRSNREILTMG